MLLSLCLLTLTGPHPADGTHRRGLALPGVSADGLGVSPLGVSRMEAALSSHIAWLFTALHLQGEYMDLIAVAC